MNHVTPDASLLLILLGVLCYRVTMDVRKQVKRSDIPLTILAEKIESLREAFNLDSEKTRILLLLSPT